MASPQVKSAKTAGEAMSLIDGFLSQVRGEHDKIAADTTSQKDKPENTPTEQAQPKAGDVSTEQRGLGKEQTAEAESGPGPANVSKTPPNTNADATQPGDGKGKDQPQQTAVGDEKVPAQLQGELREEQTVQQKVARTVRLGNAILTKLAEEMSKNAPQAPARAPAKQAPATASQKTASDEFFQKCAQHAAAKAQEFFESYLHGMMKRAEDEGELAEIDWAKLGVTKQALDAAGGPSGLLDKVAAEDPAAILPPELTVPPPGPEAGMSGDAGGAMGAPDGAAGAAPGGVDANAIADALAEAGVSDADIDQAASALADLFQSGVSPQEAAQAVSELLQESGGAGGEAGGMPGGMGDAEGGMPMGAPPPEMLAPPAPEGGGAEPPAEPPAEAAAEGESAPTEESEEEESGEEKKSEKEAAEVRRTVIKSYLRGSVGK